MSREQLSRVVEDLLRRSGTDPSLITGETPNDGIAVYDPKTNTIVIRDLRPDAPQGGTVFKPDVPNLPKYLEGKIPVRTPLSPGNFADVAPPEPPPVPRVEAPPVNPRPAAPPPAVPPQVGGGGGSLGGRGAGIPGLGVGRMHTPVEEPE